MFVFAFALAARAVFVFVFVLALAARAVFVFVFALALAARAVFVFRLFRLFRFRELAGRGLLSERTPPLHPPRR